MSINTVIGYQSLNLQDLFPSMNCMRPGTFNGE
jgi:hypothetical protein